MTDLVFYTNPMSRGRIARWMLEEVGQPYDTVVLDYGPTMKAADYLAINPMGKVPAIRHGDVVVTETAAVCAYLADAFPDAALAPPPGSPARGAYYRWLFFAAGPLEAAVTDRSLGVTVPSDKSAMVGYGDFATVLDVLDRATGEANARGGWLAGDRFSAADLYVGAHLSWGLMFKSIEPRDSFAAFVERVEVRPAHVRATGLDDAAMAAQQAG
jgi:glutathione S-transferase